MTIELKDISKAFGGRMIFENINWQISSDDSWALTGPGGSGKTTLLRILISLERPDSGEVNLLGDYKYDRVNAGVVFQEDRLCEQFSAVENVAMVNDRLSESVAREELLKFMSYKETDIPVMMLSSVIRRIVVMVRACIIPSDILILDEPFRGMDVDLQRRAVKYIKTKAGHKGIVIAQRNVEGLQFCRRFALG